MRSLSGPGGARGGGGGDRSGAEAAARWLGPRELSASICIVSAREPSAQAEPKTGSQVWPPLSVSCPGGRSSDRGRGRPAGCLGLRDPGEGLTELGGPCAPRRLSSGSDGRVSGRRPPRPGTDSEDLRPKGGSLRACSHRGSGPRGETQAPSGGALGWSGGDRAQVPTSRQGPRPPPRGRGPGTGDLLLPRPAELPARGAAGHRSLPPCAPGPCSLVVEDDVRPPDKLRGDSDGGDVLVVVRVPAQLVVMPLLGGAGESHG